MRWAMKTGPAAASSAVTSADTAAEAAAGPAAGPRMRRHVVAGGPATAAGIDDHVQAGAAVQRLWLTATGLGLQHQPEMTPLIFAGYHPVRNPVHRRTRRLAAAGSINRRLERLVARTASNTCLARACGARVRPPVEVDTSRLAGASCMAPTSGVKARGCPPIPRHGSHAPVCRSRCLGPRSRAGLRCETHRAGLGIRDRRPIRLGASDPGNSGRGHPRRQLRASRSAGCGPKRSFEPL